MGIRLCYYSVHSGKVVTGSLVAQQLHGTVPLLQGLQSMAGVPTVIMTLDCYSSGIFYREGRYYFFDTHSRDAKGLPCPANTGTAVLLTFTSIDNLYAYLLQLIGHLKAKVYELTQVRVKTVQKKTMQTAITRNKTHCSLAMEFTKGQLINKTRLPVPLHTKAASASAGSGLPGQIVPSAPVPKLGINHIIPIISKLAFLGLLYK